MSSWPEKKYLAAGAAVVFALVAAPLVALGQQAGYAPARTYHFGKPATKAEIAAWNIDVRPDGKGLPAGSGTYAKGEKIYAQQCAACHGDNLHGIRSQALPGGGGPALIGGRGTLDTPHPVKTVESYWPYASTLYDYINRAMPYTSPSSLKPDQVYSLVAYILGKGHIISTTTVMNAKTLPKVKMPNRNGFYRDNRPFPVKAYE